MIMKIDNVSSTAQLASFLAGTQAIAFEVASDKRSRYQLVEKILKQFRYAKLKRTDKGVVIKCLMKVTGYSRQQMTRMIQRFVETNRLKPRQKTVNGFERLYLTEDIQLLAELDQRHDTPNGLMVKKLCERAYQQFNELAYQRLSNISVAHIDNLRKSNGDKKIRCHFDKTKSKKGVHMGERRKPINHGKPGYIRIDTVHQGD